MADLNLNQTLAKSTPSSITPVDNPPKDNPSQYDEVLNQYSQSKPEETISKPESKPNSWTENLPKSEPEIKTETESIPETPIETTLITEPTLQPEITPETEIKTEPVIPEPSIEESVEEPEIQPEITLEPESETFLKPQPEIEVTPEPLYSQKTPDQIKQEISQILDGTSTDSASNIIPPVKSKTNIFQILLVLSLIIFLIVVSAVVYFVFFNKTASDNSDNSIIETITPTPISSVTCTLNDKTYKVGESFPSADGCNTCSCTEDSSIVCTSMACESTKSATPTVTKSATTSSKIKVIPTPTP